jgi:hypothetical protein
LPLINENVVPDCTHVSGGVARRAPYVRSLLALVVAGACTLAFTPNAALGARSTLGLHNVSNASGADVHRESDRGFPNGPYLGHLRDGDGFRVKEVRGEWCGGSAGGNVDQNGWVLCRDLNDI